MSKLGELAFKGLTMKYLVILLLLSGCSDDHGISGGATPLAKAISAEQSAYRKRVLDFAVIDVLETKLPFIHDYGQISQTQGACDLNAITEVREWVKTLTDKQLQATYFSWLDVYDRKVRERMSPTKTDELAELHQQIDEAQILSESLPQPPETKEHCVKLDEPKEQ